MRLRYCCAKLTRSVAHHCWSVLFTPMIDEACVAFTYLTTYELCVELGKTPPMFIPVTFLFQKCRHNPSNVRICSAI